jgi:hypothetical protein
MEQTIMRTTSTTHKDYLCGWQNLVDEIKEIEDLIADARTSHDTQALWSLHLLQSQLRVKRQMLRKYVGRTDT